MPQAGRLSRTMKTIRKTETLEREKLEALGRMTSSIVHEVNNMLQPVITYADMALDERVSPKQRRLCLERIERSAEDARSVLQSLLAFARKAPERTESVALDEVIREAAQHVRGMFPAGIRVQADIAPSPHRVVASEVGVRQILLNLLGNAADAMGQRGVILVQLEDGRFESAELADLERTDPRCREFRVIDDGPGMSEDLRRQAFAPFFTTKPAGHGTGLGLAVCRDLVERWGGTIAMDSAEGAGTTCRIRLPIVPD